MTIKEARELAGMTQQDVENEFGVPRRSLQNWEAGVRECPGYVEEWLIEKLMESVRFAEIRWEEEKRGFSCYLNDPKDKEMTFSWFYPVDENGTMSAEMVWKIFQMTDLGWKVNYIK